MGRKDTIGRSYFKDRERFAELMNATIYQGEAVIQPENLVPKERDYPSLSGRGDKSRDILMEDMVQSVIYALELETESDYGMPERVMVYDSCEYERQIREITDQHKMNKDWNDYREMKSRIGEEDRLLPVITVVLYLGNDRWEGGRMLSDLFRIPDKIKELLGSKTPDYGFHLAEADYIDAESYRTDLREFFHAMQCRKDKQRLNELLGTERFRSLRADAMRAIAVHIDRPGLTARVEKEGITLCQAFDELMEDKRQEGIKEGMQKGIKKGLEKGKKAGIKEGIKKGKKAGKKEGKREGIKEGKQQEKLSIISQMLKEGMEGTLIRKITKCTDEEMELAVAGKY